MSDFWKKLKVFSILFLSLLYESIQKCNLYDLLIENSESFIAFLKQELESMDITFIPPIDIIGWENSFMRISLEYIKQNNIPLEIITTAFIQSNKMIDTNKTNQWNIEWNLILNLIEQNNYDLIITDYYIDRIKIENMLSTNPQMAMHHSQAYRDAYKPHYRIINTTFFFELITIIE